ncbi:hypothetical protein M3Y96_01182300 [Aphelenchoides besseyi]|nr:hypothetical protein M3Y96_01182300 [Aphelenchoides besseyi]
MINFKLVVFILFTSVLRTCYAGNVFGLSGPAANVTVKCLVCTNTEYQPAFARHILDSWNTTETQYNNLPSNCEATNFQICKLGEMCAKKTVSYTMNYQSSSYVYQTYVRVCADKNMHGTDEIPKSGQCYDDKTNGENREVDGVQRKATWCYCRNQDLCNSTDKQQIQIVLIGLLVIT